MEKQELTSDDLANCDRPLTGRDLIRILRVAEEMSLTASRLSSPPAWTSVLIQAIAVDSGFGSTLRQELLNELATATISELGTMRNALLAHRTPLSSEPKEPANDEP